ncbi:MAG: tetratricopeptide repeat protein [Alphaproteobacteria bacterium]
MKRFVAKPLSLTIALVVVVGLGGAVIAWLPPLPIYKSQPSPPVPASPPTEEDLAFTRAFTEGVKLLKAGHAPEALELFAAAARRRPHAPALWVNIGFARLANKETEAAVMAFQKAINIDAKRVNGYYGLAMALEAQEDIQGALGAMRTYLHLAPQGTDFYRRASSAVWEWEERLKGGKEKGAEESPKESPKEESPKDTGSKP